MRKKLLGTIAALAAGAGGALAQTPSNAPARAAAPVPLAASGAFDGGDAGVRQVNNFADPIPPHLAGPGGEAAGGVDPMMGGGAPVWPPPGINGGGGWEDPAFGGVNGAPKFYVDGSYLLLFPESQPVGFPLLTTGSSAQGEQGRVGASTTTILSGNRGSLGLGTRSGFRINGGFWRPSDGRIGVEVGGFYQSPGSNTVFARSSDLGIPLIARPYVAPGGAQQVLVVSSLGLASGSALSRATTTFWGVEASGLLNVFRTCPDNCRSWTVNLLGGYRFAELNEVISVSSQSTVLPGRTIPVLNTTVTSPTSIEVRDRFEALNKFHGGQVGVQSQFHSGRWYVGATGKVAFGATNQAVTVDGSTTFVNTAAGNNSTGLGGLFATAANIGRYRTDHFAILTDLNLTLGYNFTRWLTGTAGYNFVHLSAVARPGNLFNGTTDPALVPTSGTYGTGAVARTPFSYSQDDFFTHGLNFGFIIRY